MGSLSATFIDHQPFGIRLSTIIGHDFHSDEPLILTMIHRCDFSTVCCICQCEPLSSIADRTANYNINQSYWPLPSIIEHCEASPIRMQHYSPGPCWTAMISHYHHCPWSTITNHSLTIIIHQYTTAISTRVVRWSAAGCEVVGRHCQPCEGPVTWGAFRRPKAEGHLVARGFSSMEIAGL